MSPTPGIVTLKPRKALPFFSRHPWVFTGAIHSVSGALETGTEVIVRAHDGKFVARGLFNPESNIRVRLYSWDENQPLDDEFWRRKIQAAIGLRRNLFHSDRACRVVFSEGDGISGLIVDRFNDWLVVQWTSSALQQRQDVIIETLQAELNPTGIWLRTERGIREQEGLNVEDGLLRGTAPDGPVLIEENGLTFEVDLQAGQKTGYYFDQRDNRQLPGRYGRSGRLLDVCTYTGGFALFAAYSGSSEVVAVDSSQAALDIAERNAERNGLAGRIAFHCDDAFDFLESQVAAGERYQTIVLDPPKLARTRSGIDRALKAYARMNRLALQLLEPDGILITCSCSGHVLREDFEQVIARASLDAGRTVQILEERGQAADHPVSAYCLETSYLKCFVIRAV